MDMKDWNDRAGLYLLTSIAAVLLIGWPVTLAVPAWAPWPAIAALTVGGLWGRVLAGKLRAKQDEAKSQPAS